MTDDSPETELLRWLMQCHGSQYLAAPGVPRPDLLPSWAQGVGMEEFEIDYEPRCLAVSSHGPRVMVGTKAGSIYLVIWDAETNRWRMEREWKGGRDYKTSPLHAIRAIAMLDDKTLVAGLGAGSFLVFSLGATRKEDQNWRVQGSGSGEDRSWLNRYSRLIRLHPYNQTPKNGDLVLGISLGGEVHLLSREKDEYKVSSNPKDTSFLAWDKDWGRVLDATWSCDCLWLLSSRGFLLRYRRDEQDTLRFDAGQGAHQLEYRRRGGAFRGLSSCIMGLSVLASDHVAFLRYQFENETTPPRIDPQQIHWFSIPDAIDGTVCLPYHPQPGSSPLPEKYLQDPENPVWTVVTTGKNQLYWVAWPDFPRDPKDSSWLPWRAPALFTNVGKGALYSRFGWPLSGHPPFLVVGTRDHKLRIVSVLDRKQCENTIEYMVASRGNSTIPGAELWNLQQSIKSDFASLRSTSEQQWTRQLLGGTTEDNLRTLVVIVLRAWTKKAPKKTQEQQLAAKNLLTDWMLRLFQRAYEFGPELARDLAQSAYDRIAARRGNEGAGVERWKQLGLFAGFLRKWILRGSTYEEKPANLRQLYEWNRDCEHHLDALAYLTKLFRRRVDPEWTVVLSEGGSAPAVWDVAACPPGSSPESPFAVTSLTDGSLSVFSSKGRRLPWRMAPSRTLDDLKSEFLEIDPQGHRLRHSAAGEFIEKYRHGPYARSLLLLRQGTADSGNEASYLLFFPLRGWRSQDRDREDRKPRVCALSVRPEFGVTEHGRGVQAVLIEGVKSVSIDEELYALCELETPDREPGVHLILAGTSGTVKQEQSRSWIPCPFREFEIRIAANEVAITVRSSPVYLLPKGQRSLFRNTAAASGDTAYNPCWVLVCSQVSSEGARVWAGFQDGSLRGFQRRPFKEANEEATVESGPPQTWFERGWVAAEDGSSSDGRQTDFKVAAAVWSLHMVEHKEKRYLAYGTGDGTLGMVDLDAIESSQPREFCHLIHTREASPISTLIDYTEDGGQRLLAVTQQGIVCIFSLDFGDDFEKGSKGGLASRKKLSHRFVFPGLRLDHFSLRHSARAMVRMDNPSIESGEGPRLLIGSVEGSIHQHHLRYPRKSSRRDKARQELQLMPGDAISLATGAGKHSELENAVGRQNALAWLRVLDLSDLNLVKFSLWRDLLDRDPGTPYPPNPYKVERYIEHLHHLADEVYGRRPFSSEPAKVLWEVTGRFANEILANALQKKDSDFGACLDAHRDLAVAIDDLCNRWIGFHQSFEAKVLIHSFEAFFDWTHIVLLAGRHEEEAGKVDPLRRFLLNKIVQRRLYHSDSIVALEMLRILNDSMIRAIAHARPQQKGQVPFWTFGLREGEDVGFYDLMTMVGDLGERLKESLTPANPFSTEIIRFFALSLLLVPDSALIIGQVVSESRLTERGNGLAKAVSLQAKEIAEHLKIGDDENLDRAIRRFDSYCSTEARLDLLDHWPDPEIRTEEESPWLFLLLEALNSKPGKTPSDEDFLGELKHVLVAASWLSRLDGLPGARQLPGDSNGEDSQNQARHIHEQRDKAIAEALEWLKQPEKKFYYFKHSAIYLKELRRIREIVRELSGLTGKNPSIKKAMTRCEDELRRIDDTDLFQPQRTHFQGVIRSWYEYLMRRAEDAVRVLDIIDEFNRHVYRTSADNLMTSLTELAMQTAPFSYYERLEEGPWKVIHEGPVRRLIHKRLEGNTLIREVFERGDRLVDYTHLSGTLLEVARDHLGRDSMVSRRIDDQITGAEVKEEIERERAARGLILVNGHWWGGIGPTSLPKIPIPGTRATWNAIIQEYARNVSRYCHNLTSEETTSTFLKAAVHEDCVLLSGSVPFLDSLPLDFMRKEIHDAQGKADVEKVRKVIASLWEPRRKIHDEEMGSSSGMGLYLIKELSALCGLELELILFDPTEKPAAYERRNVEEEKKWPLCLKITWKRQSQTP